MKKRRQREKKKKQYGRKEAGKKRCVDGISQVKEMFQSIIFVRIVRCSYNENVCVSLEQI